MIGRKSKNVIGDVGHSGSPPLQLPLLVCTPDVHIDRNYMDLLFLLVWIFWICSSCMFGFIGKKQLHDDNKTYYHWW